MYANIIVNLLKSLLIILPLLVAVAYLTLFERKVIASIQNRRGPNVVGLFGLLQPVADGFKLLLKETILPSQSNKIIFIIAPIITFVLSLMFWCVIPYDYCSFYTELDVSILYIFALSSLGVYGILLSGWASNSRYAFLGSLRSVAQMVSYEVSIGLIIIVILISSSSFDLTIIVLNQQNIWYIIPFFSLFLMFFISILAETNRPPFDLPEAEAELVSGYNVEYSAMGFALFFLGEYSNIILMSSLTIILFFGGWSLPLLSLVLPGFLIISFKVIFILYLFIWVRASLPRYRYDQLMRLGWKILLPLSLFWVFFVSVIMFTLNWI